MNQFLILPYIDPSIRHRRRRLLHPIEVMKLHKPRLNPLIPMGIRPYNLNARVESPALPNTHVHPTFRQHSDAHARFFRQGVGGSPGQGRFSGARQWLVDGV
ncbi:unnamed protein product [Periconia digitata]|uniref:Uncharacterized protein n=1 Tax=Periconia digitata TaxID=1303443 RepID=A0A9W4URV1_9PLEO|nr:unnamed protein product [Periconia digitata]